MDKNSINDIGDWFKEKIEPLSQPPGNDIWKNLEKHLDNAETSKYKNKFQTARKVAAILFFLLIGFTTATVIYIKKIKNNAENKNMNSEKNKNLSNNIYHYENSIIPHLPKNTNHSQTLFTHDQNNEENNSQMLKKQAFIKPGSNIIFSKKSIATLEKLTTTRLMFSVPLISYIEPDIKQTLESIPSNEFRSELEFIVKDKMKLLGTIEGDHSVAKNISPNTTFTSRYTLIAFTAWEFAGYNVENDEVNPQINKQIIEQRENPLLSTCGGVIISRKLNKHWNVQSGIIYSSANISIDPTNIYAVKDDVGNIKYRYNTSSGFAYFLPSFSLAPLVGDSLYTRVTTHNLQHLSIPIMLKYAFEKKKFSFNPAVGISVNFLTKAKLETEIENSQNNKEIETTTKLESIKKIGYSFLAIPEIQYKISNRLSISALPYFKYGLSPITKSYAVRTYPFSVGLGMGVAYKF